MRVLFIAIAVVAVIFGVAAVLTASSTRARAGCAVLVSAESCPLVSDELLRP